MNSSTDKTNIIKYSAIALGGAVLIFGGYMLFFRKDEQGQTISAKIMDIALSKQHEAKLKELHALVQDKFRQFLSEAQATGWNVIITSAYRSFAKQAALKAENSKNATAGLSPHNFGMALDINLQKGAKWVRKASPIADWEATGVPAIARKLGMRWGGDFKNYHDPVHFDFLIKPTATMQKMAIAQFGNDNNKIIGNQLKLT